MENKQTLIGFSGPKFQHSSTPVIHGLAGAGSQNDLCFIISPQYKQAEIFYGLYIFTVNISGSALTRVVFSGSAMDARLTYMPGFRPLRSTYTFMPFSA
jgi:hypothetical protein